GKMQIDLLKNQVLLKSKEAYAEKLFAGTSGNLSIFDRESGLMAITPTSIPYPELELEDIVLIRLNGDVESGPHKPSSEWRMHAEIYKNREDVNAIVHTHSPFATAFAVANQNIPVILIEMMFFLLGDVPLADYQSPGSKELGISAVEALQKRGAALLANHGIVAIGKDIDEAYIRAIYTEDAASIYIKAKTIGEPKIIPMEEQNKIRDKMGIKAE
ncbi:MAG: class II aldolase/adducin family protein, partial [Oscillospiraceae bacterium]